LLTVSSTLSPSTNALCTKVLIKKKKTNKKCFIRKENIKK